MCVNGVRSNKDPTLVAARELSKSVPQMRVLSLKPRGKNIAINYIAKKSNPASRTLFFCDADVLLKRQTIERVIDALKTRKGVRFAGALVTPATSLIPERSRSSFKSYFLKRHKNRVENRGDFVSGAGWAVEREFFLKNPLPPTNKIADDVFINTNFKGRIALVRNAKAFYMLPAPKDRLFQKARYVAQEKAQGVKQQSKKSKGAKMKLTLKERRGLIINVLIERKGLAIKSNVGWRNLSSTKLRAANEIPELDNLVGPPYLEIINFLVDELI